MVKCYTDTGLLAIDIASSSQKEGRKSRQLLLLLLAAAGPPGEGQPAARPHAQRARHFLTSTRTSTYRQDRTHTSRRLAATNHIYRPPSPAMLARTAVRTASTAVPALRRTSLRTFSSLKPEHQYSAHATSHGSRANGLSKLDVRSSSTCLRYLSSA